MTRSPLVIMPKSPCSDEKGGRAGRGQGRGNLLADMAGLADAGDHYLARTSKDGLAGRDEGIIEPRAQPLCLGQFDTQGFMSVALDLFTHDEGNLWGLGGVQTSTTWMPCCSSACRSASLMPLSVMMMSILSMGTTTLGVLRPNLLESVTTMICRAAWHMAWLT